MRVGFASRVGGGDTPSLPSLTIAARSDTAALLVEVSVQGPCSLFADCIYDVLVRCCTYLLVSRLCLQARARLLQSSWDHLQAKSNQLPCHRYDTVSLELSAMPAALCAYVRLHSVSYPQKPPFFFTAPWSPMCHLTHQRPHHVARPSASNSSIRRRGLWKSERRSSGSCYLALGATKYLDDTINK